jgi:predicted CoA-binding protein
MAAGYSANPLSKKLGLKEGYTVKLVNPPGNYKELIGELAGKLVFNNKLREIDFINFFTNSLVELETELPQLKNRIKKDGMIWVSWYKKPLKSLPNFQRI